MKVLVTGGCGFLGSNLASHFMDLGAEIVVMDALYRKGAADNLQWLQQRSTSNNFHFLQGDVADDEFVKAGFRRHGPFDYVCHVAGQVAMTHSLADPRRDLMTNIMGTFNVLEAIRQLSPEAMLAFSSTNKVYGDLASISIEEGELRYVLPEYPAGFDESLPLDFSTPYGCSKGSADQYVRDWSRVFGLKTVVFRHSSIFGGRQFATFDQGWVGWFCQKGVEQAHSIRNGQSPRPFTISGTGKQVRDVLHADDLCALYHAAYERRDEVSGEVFNIGGGLQNSLSLLELFRMICELLSIDSLVFEKIERRASDQDVFVADIAKAERLLGWKPSVDSRTGLERMLRWTEETYGMTSS